MLGVELIALTDAWAQRRMLVATSEGNSDPAVAELVAYMVHPSQTAKPRPRKKH